MDNKAEIISSLVSSTSGSFIHILREKSQADALPQLWSATRIGMMPWILLASGHALTRPWLDARSWMCYETDASLVASLSPCANFANSVFRL